MFNLEKILSLLLCSLLLLLPFPAIWLIQEKFLNESKWEHGTLGFYATEGLLWAGAILFTIWYIKKSKLLTPNSKIKFDWTKDRLLLLAGLLLISYHLSSTLWALAPDMAFQQTRRVIEAGLLALMLMLGPLTFRQAAGWFVAGATLQSILGIWQFLTQSTFTSKWLGLATHPVWEAGTSIIASPDIGRWLRAYGAFPHPNILGGYLVIAIIITTIILYKSKIQNPKSKIFLNATFTVQITALFFTFSRAAWIAFTIWMIGLLITRQTYSREPGTKETRQKIISYQLSVIIILTIIFFPLVKTRLTGNSINEAHSTSERLAGYRQTLTLVKQHPWLGVGASNYTATIAAQNTNMPGWQNQPVHNVPLLIITELGITGALLSILVITVFVSYFFSLIKQERRLYYFLLITPFLILTLFDHYLYSSYIGLLLAGTYLGLWLKLCQSERNL